MPATLQKTQCKNQLMVSIVNLVSAITMTVVVAVAAMTIGPSTALGAARDAPLIRATAMSGSVKILATTNMLTPEIGFAIGGTGKKSSKAYLLATSNGGANWKERSELSYELPNAAWAVPHLDFVSKDVGYTDANVAGGPDSNQGVYVTLNGGFSWRRLIFAGYTPTFAMPTLSDPPVNESYQIADGILTLVSLHCTKHELTVDAGNWCPSFLNEFRVGAIRPFKVEPIPSRNALPNEPPRLESVRLLAATGASNAIVALGDMEAPFPVLESSNGGSAWSTWSNPCYRLRGSTGINIKVTIQDLRIAHTGWYLTCYEGGGMSQGTLYLGRSNNHGQSWTLLSQGSEGANAGNIPFVGNIGDTDVEMWVSNDGSTLWSWDRFNSGLLDYSSDGGRLWRSISTPGSKLPNSLSYLSFDPIGAHGAIVIFPKGSTYSTSNGRTWFRVTVVSRALTVYARSMPESHSTESFAVGSFR